MTGAGLDVWMQGVSTVGFPIVAYILMYKFAKDTVNENTKAIRDLEKTVAED